MYMLIRLEDGSSCRVNLHMTAACASFCRTAWRIHTSELLQTKGGPLRSQTLVNGIFLDQCARSFKANNFKGLDTKPRIYIQGRRCSLTCWPKPTKSTINSNHPMRKCICRKHKTFSRSMIFLASSDDFQKLHIHLNHHST